MAQVQSAKGIPESGYPPKAGGGSNYMQDVVSGLPPEIAKMLQGVDLSQLSADQLSLKFKGTTHRTRASRQPVSFVPANSKIDKMGRTDPYFIAASEPEASGGDDSSDGE